MEGAREVSGEYINAGYRCGQWGSFTLLKSPKEPGWTPRNSPTEERGKGRLQYLPLRSRPSSGRFLQSPLNSGHFGWFQVWTEGVLWHKADHVHVGAELLCCLSTKAQLSSAESPGLGRVHHPSCTRVPNGETVFPTESRTLGTHCAHKGTQLASTLDPTEEPLLWRQMPLGTV